MVLALLLTDLFFVVRFVDMPYPGAAPPDPEVSPAAAWLKQNAPNDRPYRIWGLGDPYGRRQPELLLARTNRVHGIASISTYGPFQNPAHAHFLGFRIFGTNRDWRWLLGRNDLLAACGVRYVLVEAGGEFDTAIQAPRRKIEAEETLPCDSWTLAHAKRRGDVMVFRTPWLWRPGEAKQRIPVEPNTAYRLSMDLRAPHGGAAGYLQVDLQDAEARADYGKPPAAMVVAPEQIGEDDWRRFEWTFPPAGEMCDEAVVRIFTFSERPIEVRNLRIGACVEDNDAPRKAGYRRVASLPALRAGDPEIRIYENTSLIPPGEVAAMTPEQIEAIKWSPAPPQAVPEMGVSPSSAGPGYWLWRATLPAAGAYLLVILGMRIRRNRTGTRPISGG